jgi:hypothetical protein
VTPIRPNAFPAQFGPPASPTTAAGQAADAARTAAQKAFFDAAMGRSGAPAAPSAPTATSASQASAFAPAAFQRVEIRPQPQAEAPAKILRPGSLLDIRV